MATTEDRTTLEGEHVLRLRMIGTILRLSKLGHMTAVFFISFALTALVICVGCPEVNTFPDALWLCFQTVTTVGFGDVYTGGPLVRICCVFISVISIFYLAIVTGVVVAYCTEMVKIQTGESVAALQDELEHLDEKTPEELRNISARVAKMRIK